ncbi:MAG: CDP-alcohol phosphatidyltransferase family protein [Atopobiaceae bacterium]|jgi:cardiolipin synthase
MTPSKERAKSTIKQMVAPDAADSQAAGTALAPVGTSDNPSHQILTLANFITVCRFALTLTFLILFVNHENRLVALLCYAVAAVTDFLDGQVARRTQTVSWCGKIMDPIMDRVLLFTGVLGLMITGELPIWVAIFVIGRDAYLAVGALILQHYRKRPVDVVYIGKVTTALLMFGFVDLLLGWPQIPAFGWFNVPWLPLLNSESASLGILFVYAGVICSTITAAIYTKEGIQIRRTALDGRE